MTAAKALTLVFLATVPALLLPASEVRAEHRSYCGNWHRCGFDGEAHLLDALEWMDRAAWSDCERTRLQATFAARREVLRGADALCDPVARRALWKSLHFLRFYLGSGDLRDLDDAAACVLRALERERTFQATRAIPSAVRHPHRDRSPYRYVPGGSRGGITFGNDNFRFHVSF